MHESGSRSSEHNTTGDPVALLEEWFRTHQEELLGTAYYLLGNLADAQDAIQEAFLRCWKHRNQLPEVRDVSAWIYRITFNIAKDIKKSAWNRKRESLPEDISAVSAKEKTPDDIAAENEQIQILRKRIAELDEPDREVFLLRQNGDLTYQQIAELLGIPEGTVKTRMRKAVLQMRNEK